MFLRKVILVMIVCFAMIDISYAAMQETRPVYNQPVGISSDSERVFFQSSAPNLSGRYEAQLFSLDLIGGEAHREIILGKSQGWPAFTKNGLRVVFHTRINGNAELVSATLNEADKFSSFKNIERLTQDIAADWFPSWSPSENQIAFYSMRSKVAQIYVMDVNSNEVINISNNAAHESDPTWSSKNEITFESHVSGNPDVWVMDSDGGNRRNLTNHPSNDHFGAWSPDGKYVVFSSDRDGPENLYIINRDGSMLRQLTNSKEIDHWPRWSANGNFITFERRHEKGSSVHVVAPDGSDLRQLSLDKSYHQ